MLPLERGLAISARLNGMPVEEIATALYRDPRTLQRLFKKHLYTKHVRRVPRHDTRYDNDTVRNYYRTIEKRNERNNDITT